VDEQDPYLAANRALWDEWADVNVRSEFYRVEEFKQGRSRLRAYEVDEVGPVVRRSLLHLQCHFGLDTLSWSREGAIVTGADFSPRALAIARGLSDELGIPATFVESDLDDLPNRLEGTFDVVYTSRGVLGWLPDIERWAEVAAHFVAPGGFLYVTEVHPFLQVFEDEGEVDFHRPVLRYPYWSHEEPLAFEVQGSYADRDAEIESKNEYGWNHSVGEIVTGLARAGLRIEFLHEFPFLEWPSPGLEPHDDGTHRLPADLAGRLPLFFSLKASKPA
jgi:SAM-dependent methyltransferase